MNYWKDLRKSVGKQQQLSHGAEWFEEYELIGINYKKPLKSTQLGDFAPTTTIKTQSERISFGRRGRVQKFRVKLTSKVKYEDRDAGLQL